MPNAFSNRITPFLMVLPALLQAELFEYRAYTSGHIDIGPRIVGGQIMGYWQNDGANIEGQISNDAGFSTHEIRALGIFDDATPPANRPSGTQWDFLGVAAGEPIYILPFNGVPNTLPYLGFATEDESVGHLAEINMILESVTAPPGSRVSVYRIFSGNITLLMSSELTPPNNTLTMTPGNHLHYSWAFSHPGTYDLTFRFEAFDLKQDHEDFDREENLIHSGTDTFRFQITDGGTYDDYEHWRRTHFRPDHISDNAISGPSVNAVNALGETLGFTNAQRYAFGNDPTVELLFVEDAGDLWPAVRLHMRTGMTDLQTQPEFTTSLTQGEWTSDTLILVEDDPVYHDPGLKERIYRLDHFPVGPRFFRAGAELE